MSDVTAVVGYNALAAVISLSGSWMGFLGSIVEVAIEEVCFSAVGRAEESHSTEGKVHNRLNKYCNDRFARKSYIIIRLTLMDS